MAVGMLEELNGLRGGEMGKRIWSNRVAGRVLGNPMRSKGGAWGTKVIPNTAEFSNVFFACSDQSNLEEVGIFEGLPSIFCCFFR